MRFRCPKCHKTLRAHDDSGGKQGKCPSCGQALAIPSVKETPTDLRTRAGKVGHARQPGQPQVRQRRTAPKGRHPDPKVREEFVRGLGPPQHREAPNADAIFRQLATSDPSPEVRSAALETWALWLPYHLHEDYYPTPYQLLEGVAKRILKEDGDAGVRQAAVTVIADLIRKKEYEEGGGRREYTDHAADRELIVNTAINDASEAVRSAAWDFMRAKKDYLEAYFNALVTAGDAACVSAIVNAIEGDSWPAKRAALEASRALGDEGGYEGLVAALADLYDDVAENALRSLRELCPSKWQEVEAAIRTDLSQMAGADVQASRELESVPRRFAGKYEAMRFAVAEDMARNGDQRAFALLASVLEDPNGIFEFRLRAATALGCLRDPRAFPILIQALRDPDEKVGLYAAKALGKFRDPRAIDPLRQLLGARDYFTRYYARGAMAQCGDPAALSRLLAMLSGRDHYERLAAAECLGGVRDSRAIRALQQASRDAEPAIREAAKRALIEAQRSEHSDGAPKPATDAP